MKYGIIFLLLLQISFVKANDGVFTLNGNHLIPIKETKIQITKEILSIKRLPSNELQVDVNYEFFNPAASKTIVVGFEAEPPMGDLPEKRSKVGHPFMFDFSVNMNDKILKHRVNLVESMARFSNNSNDTLSNSKIKKLEENESFHGHIYVYYFKANFESGKNTIKHRYRFQSSSSVDNHYAFDYILSAAGRWANHQIEDFTLEIDMGNFADFTLMQNFYASSKQWQLIGNGKITQGLPPEYAENTAQKYDHFYIRNGKAIFHQMNFIPKEELRLVARRAFFDVGEFDSKIDKLPFSVPTYYEDYKAKDKLSRRLLCNLPFAIRGYQFKDLALQNYFESMEWYMPDANYKAELDLLTDKEKECYAYWK